MTYAIARTAAVTSVSRAAPLSPQDLFKKLDTQGKGYLTASEFEAAAPKISAEGARQAAQAEPSAKDVFARLDTNGDGQLTSAEFAAGAPKVPPAPSGGPGGRGGVQGGRGGGGPPPGAGGVGKAQSTSNSQGTSSSLPADTNGDGTVSAAEQLAYDLKQLTAQVSAAGQSTQSVQTRLALQAYQTVSGLAGSVQ